MTSQSYDQSSYFSDIKNPVTSKHHPAHVHPVAKSVIIQAY